MLLYLTWVVAKAHGRVTVFSMPDALAAVTLHYLSTLAAMHLSTHARHVNTVDSAAQTMDRNSLTW